MPDTDDINKKEWENPDNWTSPGFYFSKKDPRWIVPKRNPVPGWTFNLGNKKGAWPMLLTLLLPTFFGGSNPVHSSEGKALMISEIMLARFWGILLTILCISMLINPKFYIRMVKEFDNVALRFLFFFAVLIMGAASVSVLNQWSMDYKGLITFLGWGSVVKGGVGILMPDLSIRIIKRINLTAAWIYPSGIGLLIAGVYLLFVGFGS